MDTSSLIGRTVTHIAYGLGKIIDANEKMVQVSFAAGETKKYQFPQAFGKYLSLDDAKLMSEILEEERKRKLEEDAHKSTSIDNYTPIGHPQENARKTSTKGLRKGTKLNASDSRESYPSKNVAFKCTYNDGGKKKNGIGFAHVCSDAQIRQNIRDGRSWCSHWSCPCRQYLDGDINRKELEAWNSDGGYVCYESVMLVEWVAKAGMSNPEMPKNPVGIKLKNVFKDSIAILTTRLPGTPEQERIIFGLFIIADFYEGDEEESGYVRGHKKYRLMFTAKEGKNLKFWKYYSNKNNPSKPFWGTGLFRYITEDIGVQILRDAIVLKTGKKDEKLAKEFLQYYCEQNRIDSEAIGEPMGVLSYKQA